MATTPTGTDRWQALDFGPPAAGGEEPEQPVLVDYVADGRVAPHETVVLFNTGGALKYLDVLR